MGLFDKLKWGPHPSGTGGERAVMLFPNGYAASVIRGGMFYTSNDTIEIAVMVGADEDSLKITYDTPVTDDVLGYLSRGEAEQALQDIKALPPA